MSCSRDCRCVGARGTSEPVGSQMTTLFNSFSVFFELFSSPYFVLDSSGVSVFVVPYLVRSFSNDVSTLSPQQSWWGPLSYCSATIATIATIAMVRSRLLCGGNYESDLIETRSSCCSSATGNCTSIDRIYPSHGGGHVNCQIWRPFCVSLLCVVLGWRR